MVKKTSNNKALIIQTTIIILVILILTFAFTAPKKEVNYKDSIKTTIGNPNAPVTIIEWSDFECPYCAKFAIDTFPKIKEEYIDTGKVKFIYKHFPAKKNSLSASIASECAADQNKFWEYQDKLYRQSEFSEIVYNEIANEIELNITQFQACLKIPNNKPKDDFQEGIQTGISGTPAFLINNDLVEGSLPFEKFKQIIDDKLP